MNILNEINRLENELIGLKNNQQTISNRIKTVNGELERLIPALTNMGRSLTDSESDVVRRLTQFQDELNRLKQYCDQEIKEQVSEFEVVQPTEPSPEPENMTPEVPAPIEEGIEPAEETLEEPARMAACVSPESVPTVTASVSEEKIEESMSEEKAEGEPSVTPPAPPTDDSKKEEFLPNFDWEKFVGENLISKLGILILLIGVAIGGKYAIEHEMLSPTIRILLGSALGLALQGVAYKMKDDYKKFSAILSSGSSAILYFMTYFAYALYDLLPMPVAFALMVLITGFSVYAAWWYDMEIVAIIGQIGAYVIPFLLGGNGGSVLVLLGYIALIDSGILIVSVKKYWPKMFALAFCASWAIIVFSYRFTEWTSLPECYGLMAFAFIYFAIFYVSILAYKVKMGFEFIRFDIVFLLFNSFIFFALGYNLIYNHEEIILPVWLFSLINAAIHCGVWFFLSKKQLMNVDKALQRLVLALGVLFITVTIAIWTSGHWITIFWMMEALALFWVGRSRQKAFYENMAYPILLLAMISLMGDWGNPNGTAFRPLQFVAHLFSEWRSVWDVHPRSEQGVVLPWMTTLISVLVAVAFAWIDKRYPSAEKDEKSKLKSNLFTTMFVAIFTMGAYAHFTTFWTLIILAVEFVVLFFYARKKANYYMEICSYVVMALTVISGIGFIGDSFGLGVPYNEIVRELIAAFVITAGFVGVVNVDRIMPGKVSQTDELLAMNETDRFVLFANLIRVVLVLSSVCTCFVVCCPITDFYAEVLCSMLAALYFVFFFFGRKFKYPVYESCLLVLILVLFSMWLYALFVDFESPLKWSVLLMALFVDAILVATLWVNNHYAVSYSKILENVIQCTIVTLVAALVIRLICGYGDNAVWAMDFAMAYFALISFWASKKNMGVLAKFNFCLMVGAVLAFMVGGLMKLSIMRAGCESLGYYHFMRYASFVVVALVLYVYMYYRNSSYLNFGLKESEKHAFYDTGLVVACLVLGTSELFNIFELNHYENSYKLALSIFWGCSSMFLIYFGLFKQMKYLRIEGFVLFGIIMVKLFLYDLKHLDTLSKAIVFVVLGVLFLVSSFFYQKIAKQQADALKASTQEGEEAKVEDNVEK